MGRPFFMSEDDDNDCRSGGFPFTMQIMEINRTEIIKIISRSKRPRSGREIAAALGVSSRQKKELYQLLHEMVSQGELRSMRGGKFVLLQQKKTVQGRLRLLRNGSGIVPFDAGRHEVMVSKPALFGAMHGDLVEVAIAGSRGNRPEGRVVQVLERLQQEFVGQYQLRNDSGFVLPVAQETGSAIRVIGQRPDRLKPGQIVVLQLAEISQQSRELTGTITEILGDADEQGIDMRIIARRFGFASAFPAGVASLGQKVCQSVTPEECHGRKDLRHLPFVTIDGETAKDFDDAVTLIVESSGYYRLFVAIADVAHYVPENGLIDLEALQRGTSVYLPGICIPMLPETLSNGICSLNPQVDRLVMVAEILFDQSAAVLESTFSSAVICSHARLTYTEVQNFLDHALQSDAPLFMRQLFFMQDLAQKLTQMRLKRGALDLDIPETEILLDAVGVPESIVRVERTMAHRLIEEFMLAANEAVASTLTIEGFPLLYRIHEPPVEHDLETFFSTAKRFGTGLLPAKESLLTRVQKILASLTDKPEQAILNRLLLRSLKQAMYHPENRGHFGLAAEFYCHFTSPIRRYPDLVVHRVLKQRLAGADAQSITVQAKKRFITIADQTSKAERRAVDAERDASAMKTCQYMLKHIGEEHPGHITSVHPFGFFVELDTLFVEGMVHVASLHDAYYRFDDELKRLIGEGNSTIYATGSPVTVTVRDVNVARREIDLSVKKTSAPVKQGADIKKMRKRIK